MWPVKSKPVMSEAAYAAKMERKELTPDGAALIPDPTPIAPPLGYVKQPSITERIRDMVRSEHLRIAAEAAGAETFEEADDFDIGDDHDPSSPYEEVFEPPVAPTPDPTGVPSPGGGEGAGGLPAAPAAPVVAAPAASSPNPAPAGSGSPASS